MQATGGRPNTKLVSDLDPSLVDENSRVIVQPTLQVKGQTNIFAAGDITNWPEQKQMMKAQAHAGVIAANIISLIQGQKPSKEYKTKMEGIFVTNGAVRNSSCKAFGVVADDFYRKEGLPCSTFSGSLRLATGLCR